MSDILDDYREWRLKREERIGTHSDRCHMWAGHESCMIHRLAVALEKSQQYCNLLKGYLSVAQVFAEHAGDLSNRETVRLTDEERQAISWVCGDVADITGPVEDTLRGLLERHKQHMD